MEKRAIVKSGKEKLSDTQQTGVTITNGLPTPGINSSLTADLVVISGQNTSDDSTGTAYEQDQLTMLPASDGSTIIKHGGSALVPLSDVLYNLILAESKHLYPVKVVGEMQDFTTDDYPPINVTADDLKKMKLAEQFNQVIAAAPTSTMATDYQNALTNANATASSVSDIDNALTAFFQKYSTYNTLDLISVTALSTYYKKCVFPWAAYQDSYTYYLYSSDGSTITYQGMLTLKQGSAVPPAITDSNNGFTITFTDSNNNDMAMTYDKGQFVSSSDIGAPAVCLQGIYVLRSTLTKVATDNYMVPVMNGTVNGVSVMGSSDKKTIDSASWAFFHPDSFAGYVALIGAFLGLVMGADFLTGGLISEKLKGLRDKIIGRKAEKKGVEPTDEEIKEIKQKLDSIDAKLEASQKEILDRLNPKIDPPADFESGVSELKNKLEVQAVTDKKGIGNDKIGTQKESVEILAEIKVDPNIEDIARKIGNNEKALQKAQTSDDVDLVNTNIDSINPEINTQRSNVESQLSTDAKANLEKNAIEMKTFETNDESVKEAEKGQKNNEAPEPTPEED